MARRTIAVLVAAILALAAAGLVWWYASSVREEAEKVEGTVTVLVAAEDIPGRTTGEAVVQKGLVETAEVPERLIAPGALTSEAGLQGSCSRHQWPRDSRSSPAAGRPRG